MKRIGLIILATILIILLIPMMILGGVGAQVKNNTVDPGGVTDFVPADKSNAAVSNEAAPVDLKINVYIAEKKELKEMSLEEYIVGVVAGEMPAEFEVEALKAQAVAARSYAVTKMKGFSGKGCDSAPNADICTDSKHCQEWISKEDASKGWNITDAPKYWDKITAAVNDTRGLVITYDAVPVMYPLYFSTSSGKTENSQDVFKFQEPYLRSVVSTDEESAPKFVSKVTMTKDDFIKKFSESQYNIKLDKSKISSLVKVLNRTEGGSVNTIQVGTKTLSGTDVRGVLGLNSANFKLEFGTSNVVITVSGYGHGVGMSQWGANGMGKAGKKFDEILKHYYLGVEVSKIGDVLKTK